MRSIILSLAPGLGICLLWSSANGQDAEMITDIQLGSGPVTGSFPNRFFTVRKDLALFAASDPAHGTELWRTNGVTVEVVADILPGNGSSKPQNFILYKNSVFFTADDGSHGRELWVTDGTTAGTRLVADINPGKADANPESMVVFKDRLYFGAASDEFGAELWSSDGSASGTTMVRDIDPGSAGARPVNLTAVGDFLVFSADRELDGRELWRLSATTGLVSLIRDILPGPGNSNPSRLTRVGDLVVFQASDGATGIELWVADPAGSADDTRLLADFRPGGANSSGCCTRFRVLRDYAYFIARPTTEFSERQLWRTNGIDVEFVIDAPGASGPILAWGNDILIELELPTSGRELWLTNGTVVGTRMLKDIVPGPDSSSTGSHVLLGDTLFFSAVDAGGERELWGSDGSEAGTRPVININGAGSGNVGALAAFDQRLLFQARDDSNGAELWISDGSLATTQQLANLAADDEDAQVANVAWLGEKTTFTAYRSDLGVELWASDGLFAEPLADALAGGDDGLGSNHYRNLPVTTASGLRYFFADAGQLTFKQNLWRSDGLPGGTYRVADFNAASANGDFSFGGTSQPTTAVLDDRLYLLARGDAGNGLYRVAQDGNSVEFIAAVTVNSDSLLGPVIATANGRLFFSDSSENLWTSDGTTAGTVSLGEFDDPRGLVASANLVYFIGGLSELWRSDGTVDGTFQLTTLGRPATNPWLRQLTAHGGALYFSANDGVAGFELWISDGSVAGTRMVKDIYPGLAGSFPFGLTSTDFGLVFAAYNPASGVELWVSDGSVGGTRLVRDLAPGPDRSGLAWSTEFLQFPVFVNLFWAPTTPQQLPPLEFEPLSDGRVAFRAWDPERGSELWVTDGTEQGTRPISDIAPGAASSNPAYLAQRDNVLVFSADDGINGRELWRIDFNQTDVLFSDSFEDNP